MQRQFKREFQAYANLESLKVWNWNCSKHYKAWIAVVNPTEILVESRVKFDGNLFHKQLIRKSFKK